MKITGITIVKDNIVVELDTKIPDSVDSDLYLYIDTLNNYSNRSSVNPDKHSYKLLVLGTDYRSDVKIDEWRLSIVIDSTKLEDFCSSAFIATIDNSSQFYFNQADIYYKEVELLCKNCSTCLDDQQMDRMVLFILKQDLLSYAINNNLIDDAVQYYTGLARMLNICLDTNTTYYNNHDCFACNKTCRNGVCSLC